MRTLAPHSRLLRAIGLAPLILLVAYACVLTLNIGGAALENFFSTWVYNFVIAASALLCIMRAVAVPAERYVWVLVGLGLTCWTASELHFELFLADDRVTRYPSVGDWLFLAFYPLASGAQTAGLGGIGRLAHDDIDEFPGRHTIGQRDPPARTGTGAIEQRPVLVRKHNGRLVGTHDHRGEIGGEGRECGV